MCGLGYNTCCYHTFSARAVIKFVMCIYLYLTIGLGFKTRHVPTQLALSRGAYLIYLTWLTQNHVFACLCACVSVHPRSKQTFKTFYVINEAVYELY